MRLLPEGFDFVSTGWIRFLPEPAMNAYLATWSLSRHPGGPVSGDLDELGADAFDVEVFGGFDSVYDAAAHGDAEMEDEDNGMWQRRWSEFGWQAARKGMLMRTPRDAIAFMAAIGLIERVEGDEGVFWQPVVPVPLAEDRLELDVEIREREAALRWKSAFQHANNAVTGWLVDQRTGAPTTAVCLTLCELAGRVRLDVDETRHGLVSIMDEAGDIAVTPHPESADPDQPLDIVVDWERFDRERIAIRIGSPDDE